jgi:hypothetical protein
MTEEQAKALKAKLKNEAAEKFPDDQEKQDAYIFGTLRKLGWKPKREQT